MARAIDADIFIRDLTAMKKMYDAIELDGMIKALKEAPTIDPVKQEWISVKDRLPTEEDATNGMVIAVENDKEGRVKPWCWDLVAKYADDFTCWMPLPELRCKNGW